MTIGYRRPQGNKVTYAPQWGSKDWRKNTSEGQKFTYGENLRNSYMAQYQTAFDEATAANEKRYGEGLDIYDSVADLYTPGGQYGQGATADYERGKTKSRATAYQGLVNSGMANLTRGAGFDKSYEEEVGSSFKLNLEDRRIGAYGGALKDKAGFIERREDSYPDGNMYAQLLNQLGNSGY